MGISSYEIRRLMRLSESPVKLPKPIDRPLNERKPRDAFNYALNMMTDINVNDGAYKAEVIKKIKRLRALSTEDRKLLVEVATGIKPVR
jgi:hypothetical protein